MIKDINFPAVRDVSIAIVKDEDVDGEEEWKVFLINEKNHKLDTVLVASRGYGVKGEKSVETTKLRHFFDEVPAKSYQQVEVIKEEVFEISNEYWLSFYIDREIYDKRYVFLPEVIKDENLVTIPIINKKGILHP